MINITEDMLIKLLASAKRCEDPFPYVIIDDFFPGGVANNLADVFPGPKDITWDAYHDSPETRGKIVCSTESKFPNVIQEAFWFFHSDMFVWFIEELMQIKDLVVDTMHRGCGLHSTGRNGYVGIHSDSSRHPDRSLDQRLNLILWLNPGWEEVWGGHLELWDRKAQECRVKIAPRHNRMALFETGTTCYHGHPYRLKCPDDRRRNSLAVYYYQAGRPVDACHNGWQEAPHFVTLDPVR